MKRLSISTFAALAAIALSLAFLAHPATAQASWPLPFTLTTASGTAIVNISGDPSLSNCSVTAATGATFGGGTITVYTGTADVAADYKAVSGYADLGNPTSPASTLTAVGTLTFPVAAHAYLKLVLTGSSGASIPVQVFCSRGVARIASSGSGGGGATYQSYDQMVESDHPDVYVPLADPSASPGASEVQYGFTFSATGAPGTGAASLIFNGDKATSFGSTGNSYSKGGFTFSSSALQNFGFETWLEYPSALPSATSAPISFDTGGNHQVELRVAPSGVVSVVFQGVAAETTSLTLTSGTPYFLCFIYQGNTGLGYVGPAWNLYENNGTPVGSGTDSISGNTSATMSIGAGSASGGQGVVLQKFAVYYHQPIPLNRCKAHYTGGHSGVYN